MLIINDYFHNPFHRSGFMANLGKKVLVYSLCSMLASPFMVLPRQAYANTQNYTVFSGGTIYTMTESLKEVQNNVKPHKAKAVVVDNKTGKIIKVFKENENADMYTKNANYKQVNLGTNVMLPGFIDPHGHFPTASSYSGINLAPSPIGDVDTIEEVQARLLEKITERDYAGKGINYVTASDYDDTLLDVQRHPLHEELNKGELAKYIIRASHISGHLISVNTAALKRFFDSSYYNSDTFKKAIQLDPADQVTAAKLINKNGNVFYQITYTPSGGSSTTKELPGIIMRADAAQTLATGPDTVDTYLKCMTGTFVEAAMSYVAQLPADKAYAPKQAEIMAMASKEYASRGVTTSMQGAAVLPQALPNAQQGLLNNKLKIRTIIQPMVYNALDPEINQTSLMNHFALAWENMIYDKSKPDEQRSIGNPSVKSPKAGDDISAWNGDMKNAGPGELAAPTTLANQIYQKQLNKELPLDRIFLGSWKMVYDGSNQGYTGFFGQKGYYQLPDGNVTYFPVGRTTNPDGSVTINNLGMESINDPKNFVEAGKHYGNEGCFFINKAQDVFKLGEITYKRYHEKGQSIHCHMNGSRASSDGVTFIEKAIASTPGVKDARHTVIHAQMQELVETQRLLGNYDQYPLNNPAKLQDICTVWQGTAGMTWEKAVQQDSTEYGGYNPEEGRYKKEFSEEAKQLRKDLGNGQLMKEQNFISSYFVDHTYYWGQRHRDIFMGPGSAYNMSPLGWAVQLGHRWTIHNDTPVTPQNPLKSITIATTRLSSGYTAGGVKGPQEPIYHQGAGKDITATKKFYPTKIDELNKGEQRDYVYFDQRITVLQALHALTVNSAWETKQLENKLGQIREGFYADFVILAQDPFQLEKQGEAGLLQIADIPVVATIVGGETVFGVLPGTEAGNFVSNLESSFFNQSALTNISENPDTFPNASYIPENTLMEAAKNYGKAYLGSVQFHADIDTTNSNTAVLSAQIMGNGDPVETVRLHKYINNADIRPFTFTGSVNADDIDSHAGQYWITDRTLEKPLAAGSVLEVGKAYYIHFAIENDTEFDLDKDPAKVQDPVIVTADSFPKVPTAPYAGHGGGGGCTIGTAAQYDLALVILAALGLLAIRIYRKRDNA